MLSLIVLFDSQFIYLASNWEESAIDMRVLCWLIEEIRFYVPQGKYYLANLGCAKTKRFIASFRSYRYHLIDYCGEITPKYTRPQEEINHHHTQF